MRYLGDEYFSEYLEMLKFPRPLPEIKAIIMRNLWRMQFQPMEDVQKELYGGKSFNFPNTRSADLFFVNFSTLWTRLKTHQESGNYFRFYKFPKALDLVGLKARMVVRNLEVQALYPLMIEGTQAIPEEYKKEFYNVGAPISAAITQMRAVLDGRPDPFDETQIAEIVRELDAIDLVLEEAFNQLGWLLVRIWKKTQQPDYETN